MATYYWADLAHGGADANNGTSLTTPFRTKSKFQTWFNGGGGVNGDTVVFIDGSDFRTDSAAPDNTGEFQILAATTLIITRSYTGPTPPILGGTLTALAIIGATNASPSVLQTASAHGQSSGVGFGTQAILGNLGANGASTAASIPAADKITGGSGFNGTGAYTSGGTITFCSSKAALHIATAGHTITGLHFTDSWNAVNIVAAANSCTFTFCKFYNTQNIGVSSTGTATAITCNNCTFAYNRGDAFNVHLASTAFATDCDFLRAGYNFDDTVTDAAAFGGLSGYGMGDGVTCHDTSVCTVNRCRFSFCAQGGVVNTNTAGTSTVTNSYFEEWSQAGVSQSSGGTIVVFNCIFVSPATATLRDTGAGVVSACSAGANSTLKLYNSLFYSARGTAGTTTGSGKGLFALAHRGASAICTVKNCRFYTNGVAPLISSQNNATGLYFGRGNKFNDLTTAAMVQTSTNGNRTITQWKTQLYTTAALVKTVLAIANTTPVSVQFTAAHNWLTGQPINLSSTVVTGGTLTIDGNYTVTVTASDTATLNGTTATGTGSVGSANPIGDFDQVQDAAALPCTALAMMGYLAPGATSAAGGDDLTGEGVAGLALDMLGRARPNGAAWDCGPLNADIPRPGGSTTSQKAG